MTKLKDIDLSVGLAITIKNAKGEEETFVVGDCTPYHEPSTNDGGFGWSNKYQNCVVVKVKKLC